MNLVIDIGGTHVRMSASPDFENIASVEKFRTPKDIPTLKDAISKASQKVLQNNQANKICIGIPGIVNEKEKKFLNVPNIPNLNGQYFASILEFPQEKLIVKNDALLAALGEASCGAGVNYNVVAYITLSTGVGGARIVNKTLDNSYKFFEPGHQIIRAEGAHYDSCGQNGCLESYVSGTAFEKLYKIKPQDCVDQNIWDEFAKNLSFGLTNIIALWSPDIIVLGGSVSMQFDKFNVMLLQILTGQNFFKVPDIRKSETMDLAALYGGLTHLKTTV